MMMMMMMMMNSTQVSYFTLAAYINTGIFRYVLFLLLVCLYVVIVGANLLLIVVICANRSLHEPVYMFLCSLFVNELYGSSGVFPLLLLQLLSDVHTVPASFCFLQIFCVYSYANVEFLNLAVMSYDRYLAICHPLHYNRRMTTKTASVLLGLSWLCACVSVLVIISLSAPLQLCGNVIDKVLCGNYAVVRLACSDTRLHNIYGLVHTFVSILLPLTLIVCSYAKILRVCCFRGSSQTRQKAVGTCAPHLASLLNFSFGCCFQIIQSRFEANHLPDVLDIVLSLYFLTCQPLFTPVAYGLNMHKLRSMCRCLLRGAASR